MSFLFPSVLWGLLASLIPLIIHLVSQRAVTTIDFPSIQHIKALEGESIKKLRIIQWLLILLRALIIICLVLMCSGPIMLNNSIWVSSTKESVAVIIIDNSASLGVNKNGKSFFEKNISALPDIISGFEGVTNLQVYQTNPPKLIFNDYVEQGTGVNLESWKINQSMGNDNIWSFIDSVLQNIDTQLPNKECYILSDIPINPPSGFSNNYKKWQFYFYENEKSFDNISIKEISSTNQIKIPNHLLSLNSKIENTGNIEKRNVPIELYLNDERIGQIISHFKPARIKDFQFQAYPGKSGVIKGRIEIGKDDFAYDNFKTFELSIPEQISCKIISPNINNSFLIKSALESIRGETSFIDIDLKEMPIIDMLYLDQTDILILLDPSFLSLKAIQSLKEFLQKDGTIIWFSGSNYSSLEEIAISNLNLPMFQEMISIDGESFFSVEIIDRENPIFEKLNLRNPNISLPKVFKYNQVKIGKLQKSILSLNNNDPFLVEIQSNNGQILFLSSPLDLNWNNFGLKGLLIPLIHRALILSATDEFNTKPVLVDEIKFVKVPGELINKKWKLITPSQNEIMIIPNYKNERLEIKNTSDLGSYNLYVDNEFYTAFSTSLSEFEYPNIRADLNEVIMQFKSNNAMILRDENNIIESIKSQRHGTSLWKFFLLIAIILFLTESYISRPVREQSKH